jgi:PTH1 family peptidyl-tRNA hydrolase
MKIICGLGNPGSEYARHRHNVGFMVCERLAERAKASFTQEKFDARLAQATIGGEKALLLEPQTFMNLSGRALGGAARFYKVPGEDVLVIHDELDLPFGKLQLKSGGGTGGHNGLESIAQSWGEPSYGRLRFGIGKPQGPNPKERVIGHVLGNFSSEEVAQLDALITAAAEMAEGWARDGMQKAMNRFNRR